MGEKGGNDVSVTVVSDDQIRLALQFLSELVCNILNKNRSFLDVKECSIKAKNWNNLKSKILFAEASPRCKSLGKARLRI